MDGRRRHFINPFLYAVLFAFVQIAAAAPVAAPVIVGAHGVADLDACPSIGKIVSPLALRAAPSREATASTFVQAGQKVFLCGPSTDRKWESVVVPLTADQDCGVSSPVLKRRAYRGPCKAGWAPVGSVEIIAG